LRRRYRQLVLEHLRTADKLTPGPSLLATPELASGFAATQGVWRFLANDRVTLPALIGPLHQAARPWRQRSAAPWALVIHDWSALKYPGHAAKADQARLSHGKDRG
jgi:hypothetical protein